MSSPKPEKNSNAKATHSRIAGRIETNGNGRRYVAIDEVIESELRRIEKAYPTNGKTSGDRSKVGEGQNEEGKTIEPVDEDCAIPLAR
jgi:hypothetical protein